MRPRWDSEPVARWLAFVASGVLGARALIDALRLRGELSYSELFERSFRDPRRLGRALTEVERELLRLERVADGLLLMAALTLACWLFLRYRALDERRRNPSWALGSWLVPGLNLIEPYRIVREVHAGGPSAAGERAPWPIFVWWSSWLLYLVLLIATIAAEGRAVGYLNAGEPLPAFEQSLLAVRLGIGATLASAIAASLAAVVVLDTERRLSARG